MKPFTPLIALLLCWLLAGCAHAPGPRTDFLKLIDRPRVALSSHIENTETNLNLIQIHFSFAADARQRVPGILVEAAGRQDRRPVVIVMHGTGGRKEDELPWLRKLAAQGFVAVAIDGRYHGERSRTGRGPDTYLAAIVNAWHGSDEHPLYYDTVWDIMRLVDYLQTRGDVDAKRIGLAGISKGGIETYLTAAIDRRITVAVPLIGVQSFQWALANNDWQGRIATIQNAFDTIMKAENIAVPDSAFVQKFYDRLIPGIYSEFDGPEIIPLIAPRPLLIINSDGDKNCPLPGVEKCVAATRTVYHADNADDHLAVIIQPQSGHLVRPASEQATIDWFVKWLKP